MSNDSTSIIRPRHTTAVTIGDSPGVFALKCLLVPVVPIVTLGICLKLADEPLRGGYFLIAAITFLEASQFLGFPRIGTTARQERGATEAAPGPRPCRLHLSGRGNPRIAL